MRIQQPGNGLTRLLETSWPLCASVKKDWEQKVAKKEGADGLRGGCCKLLCNLEGCQGGGRTGRETRPTLFTFLKHSEPDLHADQARDPVSEYI